MPRSAEQLFGLCRVVAPLRFFKQFDATATATLCARLVLRPLVAGSRVYLSGECYENALHVVLEGELTQGPWVLKPGDTFGYRADDARDAVGLPHRCVVAARDCLVGVLPVGDAVEVLPATGLCYAPELARALLRSPPPRRSPDDDAVVRLQLGVDARAAASRLLTLRDVDAGAIVATGTSARASSRCCGGAVGAGDPRAPDGACRLVRAAYPPRALEAATSARLRPAGGAFDDDGVPRALHALPRDAPDGAERPRRRAFCASLLCHVPFFLGVPRATAERLASRMELLRLDRGEALRLSPEDHYCFVLLSGRLTVDGARALRDAGRPRRPGPRAPAVGARRVHAPRRRGLRPGRARGALLPLLPPRAAPRRPTTLAGALSFGGGARRGGPPPPRPPVGAAPDAVARAVFGLEPCAGVAASEARGACPARARAARGAATLERHGAYANLGPLDRRASGGDKPDNAEAKLAKAVCREAVVLCRVDAAALAAARAAPRARRRARASAASQRSGGRDRPSGELALRVCRCDAELARVPPRALLRAARARRRRAGARGLGAAARPPRASCSGATSRSARPSTRRCSWTGASRRARASSTPPRPSARFAPGDARRAGARPPRARARRRRRTTPTRPAATRGARARARGATATRAARARARARRGARADSARTRASSSGAAAARGSSSCPSGTCSAPSRRRRPRTASAAARSGARRRGARAVARRAAARALRVGRRAGARRRRGRRARAPAAEAAEPRHPAAPARARGACPGGADGDLFGGGGASDGDECAPSDAWARISRGGAAAPGAADAAGPAAARPLGVQAARRKAGAWRRALVKSPPELRSLPDGRHVHRARTLYCDFGRDRRAPAAAASFGRRRAARRQLVASTLAGASAGARPPRAPGDARARSRPSRRGAREDGEPRARRFKPAAARIRPLHLLAARAAGPSTPPSAARAGSEAGHR
ncbi:hypothetical protein SO694_00029029 [Aureococcus anophagefferens]|uniref:Cyclic nucleotide-binding domain-containing protein n=1 Tax=Aureococcus anophagefferens TaxID=44056 RepID=A0ABR1FVP5_AURAN